MTLSAIYLVSTVLLAVAWLLGVGLLAARRRFQPLPTRDLATLAMAICLLYVVLLPFKGGLAKIPGLDAFAYSIPYSLVLLLTLRLVPKPGAATALILGQALLGQLLGGGLNPVLWPYHGWCALAVEACLLVTGPQLTRLGQAITLACLRGFVSYTYSYALLAPLVWRKHYALWYVATKVGCGLVGCVVGAWLAHRLAPRIERAAANPVG